MKRDARVWLAQVEDRHEMPAAAKFEGGRWIKCAVFRDGQCYDFWPSLNFLW